MNVKILKIPTNPVIVTTILAPAVAFPVLVLFVAIVPIYPRLLIHQLHPLPQLMYLVEGYKLAAESLPRHSFHAAKFSCRVALFFDPLLPHPCSIDTATRPSF